MAAYERVFVEITDHIGTATLNRPEKANAFDPDMCEDLLESLRMLAAADAVRVIVVTGAGKAFCGGGGPCGVGTPSGPPLKTRQENTPPNLNAPQPPLGAVERAAGRRGG